MMLRACVTFAAAATFGICAPIIDDSSVLVQSRFEGGRSLAQNSNATMNGSNLSFYMTGNIPYRFIFSENYGASYHCLTEIAFYDKMLNPITATFKSQTSCYGCATVCDSCTASYGNPRAQFDGEAGNDNGTSVEDSLWSCSAVGSFVDGKGMETVEFELPMRPSRYVLERAHVGDWVAKSWVLQEQRQSGNWVTVSTVANGSKTRDQSEDLAEAIDIKKFPEDFKSCGGAYQTPIAVFEPDVDGKILSLIYKPAMHLALLNNGRGVQVDGNFGQLTLEDGVYTAVHIQIRFPTEHKLVENDMMPVGEMHIMHQSQFVIGQPIRLAILTILLQLPQEGEDPTNEEMFFRGLGLDTLPACGTPEQLQAVDLNALGPQLSSVVTTVPCTDTLHWFVASKYAHVSGFIVQEFRRLFSGSTGECDLGDDADDAVPEQPNEPLNGGTPMMNLTDVNNTTVLPDGTVKWTPALQELTGTQAADAYATGEWRAQFLEPDA